MHEGQGPEDFVYVRWRRYVWETRSLKLFGKALMTLDTSGVVSLAVTLRDRLSHAVMELDDLIRGLQEERPDLDALIEGVNRGRRHSQRPEAEFESLRFLLQVKRSGKIPLRDLDQARLNKLYLSGGDVLGEKLVQQGTPSTVQELIHLWRKQGCQDGYTLRALLSHPNAELRMALLRESRMMPRALCEQEEVRYVWREVILPRVFEEDRSYQVLGCAVEPLINWYAEEEQASFLRQTGVVRRAFRSRSPQDSVCAFILQLLGLLKPLCPDEAEAVIQRYEQTQFPRIRTNVTGRSCVLVQLARRDDFSDDHQARAQALDMSRRNR